MAARKRPPRAEAPALPGFIVTPERIARGPVGLEPSLVAADGKIIALRQIALTPLHRLLKQGIITAEEAGAGKRLRDDHDRAYWPSSSMGFGGVDGSWSDPHLAMWRRARFGKRYGDAMKYLKRRKLHGVALVGIVHPSGHGTFIEVGSIKAPAAAPARQVTLGKRWIMQCARALVEFYGRSR